FRKKLREEMTVTILEVDRGACLLAVRASRLLADALDLGLLQMNLDSAHGRFAILDPIALDFFTGKLKRALSDQSGIRHPAIAQRRPLFPNPGVAHVRPGRPRGAQPNTAVAEFIWDADVLAQANSGAASDPILALAEQIAPGLTDRQASAIRIACE